MALNHPQRRAGPELGESPASARSTDGTPGVIRDGPGPAAPTWLLSQRITEPDLPADYCERPELVERCALGRKRVTLLMAPAGFGKTTLLAACCRQARAGGVRTAWLSLAPDDTPGTLDDYLWHAFATTGLDPDAPGAVDGAGGDPPYPRTRAILRALERRRERCVLVLDDLEALSDRGSIDLVALLLRAAPPQLHVALSCRECPAGLDMTPAVFGPETVMLDVGDLRFSPSEVVRFFGSELSRTALADIMATSDGWPIMLRIARSDVAAPRGSDAVVRDVVASWIEGRLLRDFADHERELLLDLGLFEWFDARLVEEVLEQPGAFDRVTQMPQLTGLLVPLAGRGRNTYRVHPALRDFSEAYGRRKRERYRRIHRRIGRAMARRGETVAGMRHASAADDAQLAARMLVDAGGLAVWLREGAG